MKRKTGKKQGKHKKEKSQKNMKREKDGKTNEERAIKGKEDRETKIF